MRDRETGSGERAFRARDAYESAASLAVLILLSIGVSHTVGPPLPTPLASTLLAPAVLAMAGLAYFIWTWRRPNLSVALTFSLVEILATAIFIAWGAWTVVPLGRPWPSVAAAQLAIASIPLVAPPFLWLGLVLVGVFAAQATVIVLYLPHLGLGPLPATEPFPSLLLALVAFFALLMRDKRRRIGLAYIRGQSEATALFRLSPLFASVVEQLNEQISALVKIVGDLDQMPAALNRAVDRLTSLRGRVEALQTERGPDEMTAERLLLARDAQVGATLAAATSLGCTVLALWAFRSLPIGSTYGVLVGALFVFAGMLAWLWGTLRHPTARRGALAGLLVFCLASTVIANVHVAWMGLSQPTFPFVGYKLQMIGLVAVGPIRLWLGLAWLSVLTVEALALQWVLAPDGRLPPLEPLHTLVFALVALGLFLMVERRRLASIALLRAEVEASSLARRANLFLALRDQMNNPLQILVLQLELRERQGTHSQDPAELRSRIDRLRALSDQLRQLSREVPVELQRSSLDAAQELLRRV